MASLSVVEEPPHRSGAPSWIEPSLNVTPGRDPLGLQTITLDRIMPRLLPGILVLSQRARYFSLHAFLLSEYQRLRLPLTNNDLSAFIKRREFEYAVAVELCPRGCGARPVGVVGKNRASPAAREPEIERQESVESQLGGYGLNYRSPMIDMGVVVPRGSVLGEAATPVDVLDPNGLGPALADTFRSAIDETAYYREHMLGTAPIPRDVLLDLAEKVCLCRLAEHPDEQELLRRALLEPPAPAYAAATKQRCQSFALFLREVEREPQVVRSNGAFMQAVWDDFMDDPAGGGRERQTVAEWAALAAKDWWQESLASIWSHLLRLGGAHPDGLTAVDLDQLLRTGLVSAGVLDVLGSQVELDPANPTGIQAASVAGATAGLPLADLQRWAAGMDTAAAGLVFFFALRSRLPAEASSSPGWLEIGLQSSERQPSFLQFIQRFERHLEGEPTLADTLVWLTGRYVVAAHERIAYSKLPEFTFRFRWEDGRLRFYTLGLGRFHLADIRRAAMSQLSEDIGLWEMLDGVPQLTAHGHELVDRTFAP